MSGLSFKKMAMSAALIGAGAFTMFEYLILDKTVLSELDDSDAAFIGFITLYGKNYLTLAEYKQRKALFDKNIGIIAKQSLMDQDYILGLNHMSDWTTEEYFSTLGLLPEGQYPQEIIAEDDNSWEDLDEELEDDFWPKELRDDQKDRPKDKPDRPVLLNSMLFWMGDSTKLDPIDEADFDQKLKEEEEQYKIQHEYEEPETPSIWGNMDLTPTPGSVKINTD